MNLAEIKQAVDDGHIVHWSNDGYTVERDTRGAYSIVFAGNGNRIGLTWMDGVTLNGKEGEFYVV